MGVTKKKTENMVVKCFVVFSGMKHVIIPSGKTWEACWQPVPTKTTKILLAPQGWDSVWEKQQQQQSKIIYFTEMIKITEVRRGSEWTSVNLYRFLLEKLWVNPQWFLTYTRLPVLKNVNKNGKYKLMKWENMQPWLGRSHIWHGGRRVYKICGH